MKKLFFGKTLLALGVFALAAASSTAAVVWDLNPNGLEQNAGTPQLTFVSSGYRITATGYDHNTTGADPYHLLYYKNKPEISGADERGLGLFNTNANELGLNPNGTVQNYIQLDLRSILSQGFTNGQISVTSMQEGEAFRLFGSNVAGQLGTQLPGVWSGLAFDDKFVAIPQFGQFQFVSIAAASGDILPHLFAAVAPIPEMSALFPIIGLFAAVSSTHLLRRRRANRAQS